MRYAANTEVSSEKSRAEIERTLQRYGATKFMYGWEDRKAALAFEINGRRIRFVLPLPDPQAREFTHSPARHQPRSPAESEKAYEQAVRQRWRALALAIKAKLEAVESRIATFEDEFLAYVVLPNQQTVGDFIRPQLAEVYEQSTMPRLLPGIGETGH